MSDTDFYTRQDKYFQQVLGKQTKEMFNRSVHIKEVYDEYVKKSSERSDEWNVFFQFHHTLTGTENPHIWRFPNYIWNYMVYYRKNLPAPFDLITEYEANDATDSEEEQRFIDWLESRVQEYFDRDPEWK